MGIYVGSLEANSMESLLYWRKTLAETDDPKIKEQARQYIRHYEGDLLHYERQRSRRANRELMDRVRYQPVAPPPLTIFEILCSPLYVAELFCRYLFLGGMWTFINVLVIAFFIAIFSK